MRFALHVTELLLRNGASVILSEIFVGKTMRWIEKSSTIFLMISTSSITMQSFFFGGERSYYARRACWKCENGVCFCHAPVHGALFVRLVHSSNKYCVAVNWSILMQFLIFFRIDSPFSRTTQSSLDVATMFAKLRSKIAKSPKIGGKVCAHHFV